MSEAVLADAQYSLSRVLRPFEGFESVYQGLSTEIPIAFPGTRDPNAGKDGFDPNLLAGIKTPYGSKLNLWVPAVFDVAGEGVVATQDYRYTLVWRLRNLQDFRQSQVPYHFPRQGKGESSQFVIPAAVHSIVYEGPRQERMVGTTSDIFATQEMVREQLSVQSAQALAPRLPNGGAVGAYQQGLNGSLSGTNTIAAWNVFQIDCVGDELIILVNPADQTRTWDFTTEGVDDYGFSATYGTANGSRTPIRDMGVFLLSGSNP